MDRTEDTGRLLIVSNRLPVRVRIIDGELQLVPASGGLATGLRAYHQASGGRWLGWAGDVGTLTPPQRAQLEEQAAGQGIVPVYLSQEQVERYYQGFSNRVLWPLFHYLLDRVPVDATGWDAYRQANERFADAVVRAYRAGDIIWVHDYQLLLLPKLLRERLPTARIGFFLHTPFPSSEVFRILPWRREVLDGLLGADLIGFHTFAYLRHFVRALIHVSGVESDIDLVRLRHRVVQLGVFPMGVDAGYFAAAAEESEVKEAAARIRAEADGRQILLGVDRLDYTKGIERRLYAVDRLLERYPERRDRVRFIQVAVPSRGGVESYQRFRRNVEESVGRINGKWGTFSAAPVHYVHRSVTPVELLALYRAADVMIVTALRDGMNLVAKEFVAARTDEAGVLVLSEFAGASAELDGAMLVNPYDVDGVAAHLDEALSMPAADQQARMRRLRQRVMQQDVHAWARSFVARLTMGLPPSMAPTPRAEVADLMVPITRAERLRLLIDYDGTLVPIVSRPALAVPDRPLLELLEQVAATDGVTVEIVSGRSRETLDRWLGSLPVVLWAEHGFWYRPADDVEWEAAAAPVPAEWLDKIEAILQQFAADTPGAEVERKSASAAWHYRMADPEFGVRQAHELRMLLGDTLANQPFEVLEGKKVIEVRLRGVGKANVARRMHDLEPGTLVVAFGDDRTDEDMFRALPASALTIAVGDRPGGARYRLDDHFAVRELLTRVAADRRPALPHPTGDLR